MIQNTLLKIFCTFIFLQLVSTKINVDEIEKKIRPNDKRLEPGFVESYLEILKNLDLQKNVTVPDLMSLDRLLRVLNEDQFNELLKRILILREIINKNFKFENETKSERQPRERNFNSEGSTTSDEILEEDDLQKSEILYEIFTDLYLLKSRLVDITKQLPSLIENMEKNNYETNERLKGMKVNSTDGPSLLSMKLRWVREKAQNITEMLSQIPVLEYINNLKDYLGVQGNTTEIEELEEEIEDLLQELEESEGSFVTEMDEVETSTIIVEDKHSGDISLVQSSQISDTPSNSELTRENKREGRKLFHKIKTEEEIIKPTSNEKTKNKDGQPVVKVWRKTIRVFSKDKVKNQPKETSDHDEKWKVEIYNKVFKDKDTNVENVGIIDQILHTVEKTQTNTMGGHTTKSEESKENVFEKIFGNKDEPSTDKNEKNGKWTIKKALRGFNNIENETKTIKNGKLSNNKSKKYNGLNDNNETGKQSKKETENQNQKDKSWSKSFYDKVVSKTETIGNKTNNFTQYIGSITNGFQTEGESHLSKIYEGIRSVKDNVTKNVKEGFITVREKIANISNNLFQSTSELYQQTGSKTKTEGEENKWSLGGLNKKFVNAKDNFTNIIKGQFDNVKYHFHNKTDVSMKHSPAMLTKTKFVSLSEPGNQYMETFSYVTVTSTYRTVLLSTTTTDVIYEKTVILTSTNVLEISPSSKVKGLPAQKGTGKFFKQKSSENAETESTGFKDGILDKFKNFGGN